MAKSTSSAAVRSGTSPISRRYMRTGSEGTLVACPASGGRPAARSVNAGGSSSATDTVTHSHLRRDDGRAGKNGVRGSRISSWTPTPAFGDSALVQVRVGADSQLWEGFHLFLRMDHGFLCHRRLSAKQVPILGTRPKEPGGLTESPCPRVNLNLRTPPSCSAGALRMREGPPPPVRK